MLDEQEQIDYEEASICTDCMGVSYLAESFEHESEKGSCAFCNEADVDAVPFPNFAERVKPVFERYIERADDVPDFSGESDNVEYREGGSPPSENMQEIVECEPAVADALVEYLGEISWHDVKDGGEDYYATDSERFETSYPVKPHYIKLWTRFCRSVKHERRFFNKIAEKLLDRLFERVLSGEFASNKRPALLKIRPTAKSGMHIYRGRQANNEAEQRRIIASLAQQMGHPPPTSRRQGRMNAAGIAALYACFEPDTCVAELRAPVGGTVIIGKFEILRTLRLLDLRAFDDSIMQLSCFDPDFEEKYAYVDFMHKFHDEIRKPVLPDDEMLDYIPMQFVAEYLAKRTKPKLDGVIYSTIQTAEGTNIVLFQRSAIVQPDHPNDIFSEQDVEVDDLGDGFFFATVPRVENSSDETPDQGLKRKAVLRLRRNDLEARHATQIAYTTESSGISIVPKPPEGGEDRF